MWLKTRGDIPTVDQCGQGLIHARPSREASRASPSALASGFIDSLTKAVEPLSSAGIGFGVLAIMSALGQTKEVPPLSLLEPLSPLSPAAIVFGGALVMAALVWFAVAGTCRKREADLHLDDSIPEPAQTWAWLIPLSLVVIIGALLRLQGLNEKTLTHPEIYIPGIPLPGGISEPPPRLDFLTALRWHYFSEPHPWGYYLAMFGWTKLFGVTPTALRMPSVLLGILSIPVVFRLGALGYDRKVGLIAAAFLALHGFHIHTSQQARMFVPECFLGLVATWLLLEVLRAHRFRAVLEASYISVVVAGFLTEWFFWPLVGAHLLFTLLHYRKNGNRIARLLYLQVMAMVLGAHTLSHAFTTLWLAGSGGMPSLRFLREFLSFGILYFADVWSQPIRAFPGWVIFGELALSVVLLVRGLGVRPSITYAPDEGHLPVRGPLYLAAIGMSVVMVALALLSIGHIQNLIPISVFPLTALAAFPLAEVIARKLGSGIDPLEKRLPFMATFTSPFVILALVPLLMVFVGSFFRPMVDRQAILVFVPYLLIVLAAGTRTLGQRRIIAAALAPTLVLLFAASTWHFKTMPSSPRDYAAIATAIKARLQQNDVIFVRPRQWYVTPLFYYLDSSRLVANKYAASLVGRPNARVWVVLFEEEKSPPEMMGVLKGNGFRKVEEVTALGASGLLYERHWDVAEHR